MGPTIHPILTKCFFCGKDDKILLNTRLTVSPPSGWEEMHGKVVDMDPCNECAEYMKKGIIFLGMDSEKSAPDWNMPPAGPYRTSVFGDKEDKEVPFWLPDPFRTGHFSVVSREGVERLIAEPEMPSAGSNAFKHALQVGWIFIELEAGKQLGVFHEEAMGG